jgi:methylated-DNA-[protein]-cysteine S-methyltransferase
MASDTNTATRWHTVVPTPLGRLSLVRDTDTLLGPYYPHHWYMPNRATFGPRCDGGFEDAIRQLNEYFAGLRSEFGLPLAPRGDEFQHRVWKLVQQVPYGHTTTYGDLAGRLAVDVTAQQVGAAIGRNPLCIFIPCHRVVGRTGKLTGYAGAIGRKRYMLDLEQSNVARTLNDDSEGSDNTSLLTTAKANRLPATEKDPRWQSVVDRDVSADS